MKASEVVLNLDTNNSILQAHHVYCMKCKPHGSCNNQLWVRDYTHVSCNTSMLTYYIRYAGLIQSCFLIGHMYLSSVWLRLDLTTEPNMTCIYFRIELRLAQTLSTILDSIVNTFKCIFQHRCWIEGVPGFWWCFIIVLLNMQYKSCFVNMIGRSWRTWKEWAN